ncbi:hypothetical protein [Sphingosinicella sp. CPCC 101087]|uniref:hypothetical protein n=1 Tax=Sphingosinicella sp. CPCC 101087 TaxID=2497754 RepID=UPI00101D8416|nr:hypothetical protein [Sphingosinicella sp. CPCC 101087]
MIRSSSPSLTPLRDAGAWLAQPMARPIRAALLALLAGQIVFAFNDVVLLGLPLVREAPAGFAFHQIVQSIFLLSATALLVSSLVRAQAKPCPLGTESMTAARLAAGIAATTAGAAVTALFLADPAAFHAGAQEDRPLEWGSALLLLVGAGLLAGRALRRRDGPAALIVAAGLCAVLAVIGMEEISWGQRLLGFATPEPLAEVNWQQEFNFHNLQTDLFETLYYCGAALFLILFPLVRDLLPAAAAAHPLTAFVPHRTVALVSAPLLWFDYGHWDLYAIQLGAMVGLFAMLAWTGAAWRRGDRGEATTFGLAAAALVGGKLLFLAWGGAAIDLPDPTEYKEGFIALGFFAYAATVRAGR